MEKILNKPTYAKNLDFGDMLEAAAREYRRYQPERGSPKHYRALRQPVSRDHKMHTQHFKWSYYIKSGGQGGFKKWNLPKSTQS